MSGQLLSVTELNEYLRMMMENNALLSNVFVRGEISNFTNHFKTGHLYFSLKDEKGAVRAVMFRSYAQHLEFMPSTGMKVIVHGRVSVFPRDGQYQIYVDDMQPDGIGALWLAYEQLRSRLEAEGLFDPARKRPLPRFPRKVGLITSPTGAAVRDMIDVLGRRWPLACVQLCPALVQGADAPASLVSAMEFMNAFSDADVLIIGRGGGSAEDLWAFNNEELARAVAASRIPVISAVGHETDVTICDFVADLRAPTPSAAAELAVPHIDDVRSMLTGAAVMLQERINLCLQKKKERVERLCDAVQHHSPKRLLDERRMHTLLLSHRLEDAADKRFTANRTALSRACARLDALNPLRVLARGYAAVFDSTGAPVDDGAALQVGDRISVRFENRIADADVVGVRESEL